MKESETMKNSVKTALDTKKDLQSLIDYVKCYHPEIFRMIPLSSITMNVYNHMNDMNRVRKELGKIERAVV